MKSTNLLTTLFFMAAFASANAAETLRVTHVGSDGPRDHRNQYEAALLIHLLETTRSEFGDYSLIQAPNGLSHSRAVESMRLNRYPNFVRSLAFSENRESLPELTSIKYPIYRGVVGYRICFVSDDAKPKTQTVKTLENLRNLRHIQGVGWLDVEILRYAKLPVSENPNYESLFKVIAKNRADLFCRGAHEYLEEFNTHKHLDGLNIDQNFAIFYPFPLYLYTNTKNTRLITRLESGLKTSLSDGSFIQLWNKFFLPSINKANLHKRTIISLKNPFLERLPQDYLEHFYHPAP